VASVVRSVGVHSKQLDLTRQFAAVNANDDVVVDQQAQIGSRIAGGRCRERRAVRELAQERVFTCGQRHDIDIEGACEGSLACSTCHVIVDTEWYDLLKEASEDEDDMLDLAFNLTQTSRLGCQIVIIEELDGLTVRLPAATRNLLLG